ncbi:uncharacterized protein LOC111698484 [Eurytemora carolleeae]|uniref:uncharacterized protein LOC111698484 n=1 Tax=Eurytemora carolleeae TaxID=1294199 RepID=UPI000C76EBDC|nr:uncharacterized protein LOC111698484 [Eurytemora carolleeae]|eukprot:XP_023324602.1 uncharacterized protein LOC111698484 [Eurytemora affinis]
MKHTDRVGRRMTGLSFAVVTDRSSVLYLDHEIAPTNTIFYSGMGITLADTKLSTYSSVLNNDKILSENTINDILLTKSVMDKTDLKRGFLNSYACVDQSDENEYMHLGILTINIFCHCSNSQMFCCLSF